MALVYYTRQHNAVEANDAVKIVILLSKIFSVNYMKFLNLVLARFVYISCFDITSLQNILTRGSDLALFSESSAYFVYFPLKALKVLMERSGCRENHLICTGESN